MSAPAIPKVQSAVVFDKHNGPLKLVKDHPVVQQKDLKPGQALVKVLYSGVCHTDLHAWKGDWPLDAKLPLVGGHEGAGEIVAIGDNSDSPLKVGARVGIKWLADSCLDCELCRTGLEAHCAQAKFSGYLVDGSFQQYAVSYLKHLTVIPDNLDMALAAPILCAGVTVWKAIKNARTKPGDWILISGAGGGLGHLAVQYARCLSLRIVAVDTGKDKEELCKQLGAEVFVDFKAEGDLVAAVKKATGGSGPHAAIVASGSAAAYEQAFAFLRPGGTLVLVGLPITDIKIPVFSAVCEGKVVVGSFVGNRQDAIESLDFAARGLVKSHYVKEPLGNLESVYDRILKGQLTGRVVLDCCE